MKDGSKEFCSVENYAVLIPYSDLEKMVNMANNYSEVLAKLDRMEDQYAAIRGMFSECLDKIAEIRSFVGNS